MANSTNTVGYTSATPKHLMVNQGAVYLNYGIDGKEALLGACNGGNQFDVVYKTWQPKIGGITNSNIKGAIYISSCDTTLKVNVLEVTTDTLQLALMGNVDTSNANYDVVTANLGQNVPIANYLENVALVGTLSGSATPVVIILKNALCLDGIKFKVEDAKDNTLPLTFTACTDPLKPYDSPFEIHYPKLAFTLLDTPVVSNGNILLTLSDDVGNVAKDGFTVTVDGTTDVITAATSSMNTISLKLTTAITIGKTVTIGYTKPVSDASDVKSKNGVALDSFATTSVTSI